jgi:predicted nuclease of predicted toxin-antitoxin system
MKFLLDEGVTVSAGHALRAGGHDVTYFNESGLAKGSSDQLVCTVAEASEAVLVAHDGDMRTLARGHGITPARFRRLSLLKLDCHESKSAARIATALSLIEHEWEKGSGAERRLFVVLGTDVIRTYR